MAQYIAASVKCIARMLLPVPTKAMEAGVRPYAKGDPVFMLMCIIKCGLLRCAKILFFIFQARMPLDVLQGRKSKKGLTAAETACKNGQLSR